MIGEQSRKAIAYARTKHRGQTHRGQPTFIHCVAVAEHAMQICHREFGHYDSDDLDYIYTIALLHDVLEDTDVRKKALTVHFGDDVADCVKLLTKAERETYYAYINRICVANNKTILIVKLADIITNMFYLRKKAKKEKYRFAVDCIRRALR